MSVSITECPRIKFMIEFIISYQGNRKMHTVNYQEPEAPSTKSRIYANYLYERESRNYDNYF